MADDGRDRDRDVIDARRPPSARAKPAHLLPKTGATLALCRQWVRCGKPACRCADGTPHGPYHYLFWREDGRLRKRYVRRADVARVRAELARRRRERLPSARAMIREFRRTARELDRLRRLIGWE